MPRTNRYGRSGRNTACEGSLHPSGACRSCGDSRLPRAPLATGSGSGSIPHQVLHRAFIDASFHRHTHRRSNHPPFGRHALSVSGFLRGDGGRDCHSQHPPFRPQSLIDARFSAPVIYGSGGARRLSSSPTQVPRHGSLVGVCAAAMRVSPSRNKKQRGSSPWRRISRPFLQLISASTNPLKFQRLNSCAIFMISAPLETRGAATF